MTGIGNVEVKDALAVKELTASKLTLTALTTSSAIEVANGTAVVTISSVAPAGVGTATISKWLQFTDSAGVVCYIPVWT